jgi:hypothetical protein
MTSVNNNLLQQSGESSRFQGKQAGLKLLISYHKDISQLTVAAFGYTFVLYKE